ncbi:WD40 repeat, subgroup [Terriglobus saanensis SP1PR4]|uniref:WD40 repeat, subgroup n=1 Tax=Terriglobus saanensis (strain ATCC BAA-1853 / DSM 23119 / SP1PR4) TaxID=401053 RepID=E8V7X9_TERSS|nr:WD40 repeat, subgroup [Terriglobus saanensis SP1PR4]
MTYSVKRFPLLSSRARLTLFTFAVMEILSRGQFLQTQSLPSAKPVAYHASPLAARVQTASASEAYIDFLLALRLAEDGSKPEALHRLAESLRIQSQDNSASGLAFQLLTEQRANSRLILRGHTGVITHAAYSPDGSKIVTTSADHTARIWDAYSGRQLRPSLQHAARVFTAEFSPDGRRVVTGSEDGTALVWDIETARPIGTPMYLKEGIPLAHFSPDGKLVATLSTDGKVRLWNAETGQPVSPIIGYRGDAVSVAFSPDSAHAVVATSENMADILDAKTGAHLPNPMRQNNLVLTAVFSADGNTVLTASADHTAKIWDARTHLPTGFSFSHGASIEAAAFNHDATRVLTTSLDHTARVWDAKTGEPITPPLQHGAGVVRGAFSPDGNFVVTTAVDRATRVWDATSGEQVFLPIRTPGVASTAVFSPNSSSLMVSEGTTVQVFDIPPTGPTPTWVADLAEYASTQTKYNAHVPDLEKIKRLRLQLLASKDTDPWSTFGRWYFTESGVRPISPWNTITLKQYVDSLIEVGDKDSLQYAAELSQDHPDWVIRIAALRKALGGNPSGTSVLDGTRAGIQKTPSTLAR